MAEPIAKSLEKTDEHQPSDIANGEFGSENETLRRNLSPRQVQFFAIGGSIGTALFISIGFGLLHGGAGSLLLAFIAQGIMMTFVNNAMAEMTIFMPVSAAFIQHGGAWVDQAWGFMLGWNFFVFEAFLPAFEITAVDLVLTFWRDDIPSAAVITACIATYGLTNAFGVKYFGEAEFWLSGGKLVLIIILYCFTFVTMCGGNPQKDAYGFRNWTKPEPFLEYLSTGRLGRFEGFLAALWQANFIMVGPEYLAACAGEVQRPRTSLKTAFRSVYIRFALFFILGAICVGTVLSARDPTLVRVLGSGETGTSAASVYVIAMKNMGIDTLPHAVNALLLTSIYSAGDCYMFTAIRSLYAMASGGHAPQIFTKTTKNGVPIYCFAVAIAISCLAYLKLSASTVTVLNWFINLATGGQLVTYIACCVNYLFFYRALKAQGFDRKDLPYCGWFQPYSTWIALIWLVLIEIFWGYVIFLPGGWDVGTFVSKYGMALLAIATFTFWKLFKRTSFVDPDEADLVWIRPAVDLHERMMSEVPIVGFREGVGKFFRARLRRSEKGENSPA
ncbi:hypothetical protein CkaCkLH20_09955 [Colletotrichum karsti]|uniref:Amino acid permease/ SLC12A domain-containing protein n=1 Tax=Colletotrichum karsti TaxID=1095194 RepID=A0A9P6LGE8_9PEZI|nr:uncharacterized protein CkaCkLH20_09955 [Colletotrichum karsti]KAF9872458.1 hypothetical protein CkaCkLH20_09955 [Colletotrichum karsti]